MRGECYCREFHGSLLYCQTRESRNVAIKFFFSAIEAAKLLTFSKASVFHRVSFDLSVVGFCTSHTDDDLFARLGKPTGIGSEFLSARFMNNDELRQALDAASLSDLAGDLDDERRDAVDHVIDQFRSIDAVARLPNQALGEGDNAATELSSQPNKRKRNNAAKNEIENYVHPGAHDSVSGRPKSANLQPQVDSGNEGQF